MRVPCGGGVDPEDSRTGPEWAGELSYTIRTCDGLNENDSRRLTSEDLVPSGWGCLGRIKRCDDAGGDLSWRMALGLQEPPTIPRMLSTSCVWIQTGALICCSGGFAMPLPHHHRLSISGTKSTTNLLVMCMVSYYSNHKGTNTASVFTQY